MNKSSHIPRTGILVFAAIILINALVALFYAIENWRGNNAWQAYLKSSGQQESDFNWERYIPKPVPDEQNVFKAPHMQEWFVKNGAPSSDSERERFNHLLSPPGAGKNASSGVLPVLIIDTGSPGSQTKSVPEESYAIEDPRCAAAVRRLIGESVGSAFEGAQTLLLLQKPPEEIKPARLSVRGESPISVEQIERLLPTNAYSIFVGIQKFRAAAISGKSNTVFEISAYFNPSCWAAADYLSWIHELDPELQPVRTALRRPYARIEGDYEQPYLVPVPNFVTIRQLAQTLSQEAQCHLLLHNPDAALEDLLFLRDVQRMLDAPPEHKPRTLVCTMINVAITDLYVHIVSDGVNRHVWREPQLVELQQHLKQTEMLPSLAGCFDTERAAICYLLGAKDPAQIMTNFSLGTGKKGFWDRIKDPEAYLLPFAPRGWRLQNMTITAQMMHQALSALDLTNQSVFPRRVDALITNLDKSFTHHSPYNYLAAIAVPNFARAIQATSKTQSLVRQAAIACAIERYRLGKGGALPRNLSDLVPGFLDRVPTDTIAGQEFRYAVQPEGNYLLYSAGWDQKDEGGKKASTLAEGDWSLKSN